MKKIKKSFLFALVLFAMATPAYADIVWPALFLEIRLVSWWAVIAGLLIEFYFLKRWFKLSTKQAVAADLTMNLVSTLVGIPVIPLFGVAWEYFPGILLYKVFNIGTFNPGTWTVTFLFAVTVNAALETLVLAKLFKYKVGKKGFRILCWANAASVFIALVSVFIVPVRM